jgi:uncharacterized lipoprotein YddW (UPF0748 family)
MPLHRLLTITILAGILLASCKKEEVPIAELRGVQIGGTESRILESRENISEAMAFLHQHNFNVVFPVVWSRKGPIYPSKAADSLFGIHSGTLFHGRDPLAEIIEEAHSRGIAVITKFEFDSYSLLRLDGETLLKEHSEWVECDSAGSVISRDGVVWINPLLPAVQKAVLLLIEEVVRTYDVDGIQGGTRLLSLPVEGGYSSYSRQLYRNEHEGQDPPGDCRDPDWVRWRSVQINIFAERFAQEVRNAKPDIILSWEVGIYPRSLEESLQDWPAWIRSESVDLVVPQLLPISLDEYKRSLDSQSGDSIDVSTGHMLILPGFPVKVGTSVMADDTLLAMIACNRSAGHKGEVLLSYEDLRVKSDALAKALTRKFYGQPAKLPFAGVSRL